MRVLITGFPGMGKTAIAHELKKRGYPAYDPEMMRGFMHLQDRETGGPIHMPERIERGWYDTTGAFNWDLVRVQRLLDEHETIYICSLAGNMAAVMSQFDMVFILQLDDLELEQRLRARGKHIDTTPELLADTLTLHQHFETRMINDGAVPINVHGNVATVVNEILKLSRRQSI